MEMPIPCQHCGEWFDLNDGYESLKWYPTIIICENCSNIEKEEIEVDEEIMELKSKISDAEFYIKNWLEQLKQLS